MAKGTFEFPENQYSFDVMFEEVIVVGDEASTYILEDENGNQLVGVLVDEKTVFDATANDIRIGKVAATETGVTTGEKIIPSYHTTEGIEIVHNGNPLRIKLRQADKCDYTKLQALVCKFNTNLNNSVATSIVSINSKVYSVESTEELSVVIRNVEDSVIDLGITNNSGNTYLIRYFTYKEEP